MKIYIEERAIEVANFIINSNATVRETTKKFGISKSTVHMVFLFRVGQESRLTGLHNMVSKCDVYKVLVR